MGVLPNSPTTMDNCIESCVKCARACEECFTACLQEVDVKAREKCIKTLNDCAEICLQAVQFMARNSNFSKAICALCADICELVLMSVQCLKMIIVSNVLRYVENVHKYA